MLYAGKWMSFRDRMMRHTLTGYLSVSFPLTNDCAHSTKSGRCVLHGIDPDNDQVIKRAYTV